MSSSDTQDREQGPGDRSRGLPPASGVALVELGLDQVALPSSDVLGRGNVAGWAAVSFLLLWPLGRKRKVTHR